MKFNSATKLLPLTSVSIKGASSAQFSGSGSNSANARHFVGRLQNALVATVDTDTNKISLAQKRTKNLVARTLSQEVGRECLFEASASAAIDEKDLEVDLGILEACGNSNYVCVEDKGSSIGGRCTLNTGETDGNTLGYIEVHSVKRELQCEKCVGYGACKYTDQSKIGCGSCIGIYSCYKFYGTSIGANSCIGDFACDRAGDLDSVGDGSCMGFGACYSPSGAVGDSSCNGDYACYQMQGPTTVGQNSCNNEGNCAFAVCPLIGSNQCNSYAGQCQYCSYCPNVCTASPTVAPSNAPINPPTAFPTTSPSTRPTKSSKSDKATKLGKEKLTDTASYGV